MAEEGARALWPGHDANDRHQCDEQRLRIEPRRGDYAARSTAAVDAGTLVVAVGGGSRPGLVPLMAASRMRAPTREYRLTRRTAGVGGKPGLCRRQQDGEPEAEGAKGPGTHAKEFTGGGMKAR